MTEPKTSPEDRALRRIQALLSRAEDSANYEGEREEALAKAMQLMSEYGVTEAMANARKQTREEIVQKKIEISNPYSYEKKELARYIGSALNCRSTFQFVGSTVTSITLIGYQNDVARTEMLYTSLLVQAMRGVTSARPEGSRWDPPTAAETRAFRKSWLMGFTARVRLRIEAAERRAAQRYEEEHAGSGTALVLADRKTRVDAYVDELFGDLKIARDRKIADSNGAYAGDRAGRTADIGDAKVDSGDRRRIKASR